MTRERIEVLADKVDSAIRFAASSGLIGVDAYIEFSHDVQVIRKKFHDRVGSKPSGSKVCTDTLAVYLNSRESERRELFKDFGFHLDAFEYAIKAFLNGRESISGQDIREIIHCLKRRLYCQVRRAFSSGLICRKEKDGLMLVINKVLGLEEDCHG